MENNEETLEYTFKDVETFIEILHDSDSPEEFSINCSLAGIEAWSTKEFFDNSIFRLLFSNEYLSWRSKAFKVKQLLKRELPKLNKFYIDLI